MPTAFTPPKAPLVGPDQATAFAVKNATFGDGYVQRAADGINNTTDTVTLQWPFLTPSQADTIAAFIKATGGWQAISYQIPGDSAAKLWTASAPSRQNFGPYSTYSVTFTQVHDVV